MNTAARRWRKIIRDQEASGLSVAEYRRRTKVSAWSLYCWRRRFSAERKAAAQFVEVKVGRRDARAPVEEQDSGTRGTALRLPKASGVELRLPGRRCVRVRPGFDQQALRELLQVLEANPARVETEEAGT